MKSFLNTSLLIIIILFVSGCTSKHLTVKSLQPSLLHDEKIYKVIIEEFKNDRINQANYIEEKLVNTVIDNKRVFKLQPTYNNIDAIVTGEVLESSIFYDLYYDEETDYSRCWRYNYKDGKRTNECIEYRERRYPCENRTYKVKTKIEVLHKNEQTIFSKIYSKSKNKRVCFRNSYYNSFLVYRPQNIDRQKYEINSSLARNIAKEMVNDISPHYIYENITIIEKLDKDNSLYEEKTKKEFETIVELLDNGNIDLSQTKLLKLNQELNRQSYEVLYNLALTYEAKDELFNAKTYYMEASNLCEKLEYSKLIDKAITRTQKNLENKVKARSQLP
jgi:hypothetical protein